MIVTGCDLKTMCIGESKLIGDYHAMISISSDTKKREQYNLGDISDDDINTLQ